MKKRSPIWVALLVIAAIATYAFSYRQQEVQAVPAPVAASAAGVTESASPPPTAAAADLSAAIRDRLVTEGRVDDRRVVVTGAGERIGVGDRIATRRNDRDLQVANRDVWTVTGVDRDGGLLVTPDGTPHVTPAGGEAAAVTPAVTPARTGARVLPAAYVTAHVDLAYATTAHGTQGDTVTAAHLVVGEDTGAAAAYVGMTRGREANTAHLVATDPAEARQQWLAVFARDRAERSTCKYTSRYIGMGAPPSAFTRTPCPLTSSVTTGVTRAFPFASFHRISPGTWIGCLSSIRFSYRVPPWTSRSRCSM